MPTNKNNMYTKQQLKAALLNRREFFFSDNLDNGLSIHVFSGNICINHDWHHEPSVYTFDEYDDFYKYLEHLKSKYIITLKKVYNTKTKTTTYY